MESLQYRTLHCITLNICVDKFICVLMNWMNVTHVCHTGHICSESVTATVPYCSILFHTVPYCSYCFLTKLFPKVSVASKSFKICSERFAELCDPNMSVRRPGVATKTSQPLPCATWQHTTTTWHNVAQRGTTHLSRSVVFSTVFTKTLHDFRRFVSHS